VETVPLADGDLRWVFPDMTEHSAIKPILAEAAECIERLARQMGVRASWRGSGLEFQRFPQQDSLADLSGYAETGDVTFFAEIDVPRHPTEWTMTPPPPWLVEASIAVRCDADIDCGMHTIEERTGSYDTALDAARALASMTHWLLDRGTTTSPTAWRALDQISKHA
jgi:hypothetical protein